MDQPENPQNRSYNDAWQMLDQITLPVGPPSTERLLTWLSRILAPFSLYPDLVNKIQASIQATTSASLASSASWPHPYSVLVRLYAPRDRQGSQPTSRNWGFYRVGKAYTATDRGQPAAGRLIEIYLYPDG